MNFPESIRIQLVDKQTGVPVPNIALQVKLFAHSHNDYYFTTGLSDEQGIIMIKKSWLKEEIHKESSLFIMDYKSSLEQCLPKIQFCVIDENRIKKALESLYHWISIIPYVSTEIETLENCKNADYCSIVMLFEMDNVSENQLFEICLGKRV